MLNTDLSECHLTFIPPALPCLLLLFIVRLVGSRLYNRNDLLVNLVNIFETQGLRTIIFIY